MLDVLTCWARSLSWHSAAQSRAPDPSSRVCSRAGSGTGSASGFPLVTVPNPPRCRVLPRHPRGTDLCRCRGCSSSFWKQTKQKESIAPTHPGEGESRPGCAREVLASSSPSAVPLAGTHVHPARAMVSGSPSHRWAGRSPHGEAALGRAVSLITLATEPAVPGATPAPIAQRCSGAACGVRGVQQGRTRPRPSPRGTSEAGGCGHPTLDPGGHVAPRRRAQPRCPWPRHCRVPGAGLGGRQAAGPRVPAEESWRSHRQSRRSLWQLRRRAGINSSRAMRRGWGLTPRLPPPALPGLRAGAAGFGGAAAETWQTQRCAGEAKQGGHGGGVPEQQVLVPARVPPPGVTAEGRSLRGDMGRLPQAGRRLRHLWP